MANVSVSVPVSNVTVDTTNSIVSVASTTSNIVVSSSAVLSNADIRAAISVTDAGGDGSLAYNQTNGVITYTGPSASEVRAHFSNTSPVTYSASTGVIGIDSGAIFSGKTTDDLPEGSTNLYYTDARVDARVPTSVQTSNITLKQFQETTVDEGTPVSGSYAPNIATGSIRKLTLSGNLTDINPTGLSTGGGMTLIITQDATGGHTLVPASFTGTWRFASNSSTINTTAGAVSILNVIYDGTVHNAAVTTFATQAADLSANTTDDLAQGTQNIYFSTSGAAVNTTNVPEGTNEYYTTARANSAIQNYTGNIDGAVRFNGFTKQAGNLWVGGNVNLFSTNELADASQPGINILSLGTGGDPDGQGSGNTFEIEGENANASLWNINARGVLSSNVSTGSGTNSAIVVNNMSSGTALYVGGNEVLTYQGKLNSQAISELTTDNLNEGTSPTRLYYSTDRANTAIAAYTGAMTNMTGNITTTANISAAHATFTGATSLSATGNVSIGGNLNVTGNINSETVVDLFVEDRNITMQYGAVGAPSANSQLFVDRGSSSNTYIIWNEGTDRWGFSNDGSTDFVLPENTTDLAEGTNLYYTDARSRAAVSVTQASASGTGALAYDNSTGVFTYTPPVLPTGDITEVLAGNGLSGGGASGSVTLTLDTSSSTFVDGAEAIFSVTTSAASGSGSLAYDNTSGVFTFAPADLSSKIALTDLSVTQNSASGTGALSYDNSTGVFTYTPPVLPTGDITGVTAGNGLSGGGTSGDVTVTLDTSSSTFIDGAEAIFSVTTNTASGGGSLSYDNTTGVFTYTPPLLPTGDITGVTAGVGLSGGGTSGDVTVNLDPTITTASASGAGALAYDNTSGEFTFTPADSVTTATNATNIAITDDTSQDASHYLTFSSATSGNNPLEVSSSKLYFNPSSGALTVGTSVATSNLDGILNITGSGSSDLIINAKANTIIKEEFSSVNSETFNVDGKGYAFRSNNLTAAIETLSYSGSDAITSYLFNGTATSGSPDITVSSMNDKQGDASVVVADVVKQYMVLTNSWLGNDSAPFPIGTYVQSVSGSTITMSQNAQSDYTFTDNVLNPGAVDTSRNQAITIISNYAYENGSNTAVKYNIPTNQDAFGYPSTGFTASDFSYSHGSASDYTYSGTQSAYFRGKTDVMPANAFLNVRGLTVGENTTMTSRGENDALQSFGISMMWDGVTSTGYDNQIPSILAKAYSDKALQGQLSGFYKQATGPRLFFQSAYGNANDYSFNTYPRANYELGRISFSGTAGDNTAPSTLTPPAYFSVQAADDWATQGSVAGNTNLFISGTADKSRGSDIIMAYKGGDLILASGKPNGGTQKPVIFAPAQQGGTAPASNYSGDYAQWGTVNYADESGETGAKLTVTNGGSSGAGTVGNIELSVFRNDVTNGGSNVSVANQYNAVGTNMWNPIAAGAAAGKDILLFGSYLSSVDLTGLSDGQIATFDNYTGDVGTEINGNSYYVKIYTYSGSPYFGQYGIELFTDSGLTTAYSFSASSGNYGAGTMEWTVAPSVTDREYKFNLAEQSEKLEFNTVTNSTTTTLVEYSDAITDFKNRVKLQNLTTTQINALTGMTRGETVYNTTLEQICFYNGTAWQKVTSANM